MEKIRILQATASGKKIIQIRDLDVVFPTRHGPLKALEEVSLDIYRGETLGLVGESGCGKSTLGFTLLNALQSPGRIIRGEVLFRGENILQKPPKGASQAEG